MYMRPIAVSVLTLARRDRQCLGLKGSRKNELVSEGERN